MGAALAAVPGTASAAGGTLYVNGATAANCSDTASGAGTSAQPFCGIQAAVDAARPGDTVLVASGVYKPVDIKTSGTASAPITIARLVTTSQPSVVAPVGSSGPALVFDHVQNVVLRGLFVGTSTTATSLVVSGSSNVTVDQSRIAGGTRSNTVLPAVSVDAHSSSFTVSRTVVDSSQNAVAIAVASGASGTALTTDGFVYQTQPAVTACWSATPSPRAPAAPRQYH